MVTNSTSPNIAVISALTNPCLRYTDSGHPRRILFLTRSSFFFLTVKLWNYLLHNRVILRVKKTAIAIKWTIEWSDMIFKMFTFAFSAKLFHDSDIHFRSLWPWPLIHITNFNRVRASAVSNHAAKTASKRRIWNCVHRNTAGQTDRHTHIHTYTHRQTDVNI